MKSSAKIRSQLIDALGLDLVGPIPTLLEKLKANGQEKEAEVLKEEILDRGPSRWY